MYRKLNNQLRRETESAREKWWKEQCSELEVLERKGRTDLIYAKVRELTGGGLKGSSQCNNIKDENGKLLMEPEKVKDR